MLRAKQKEHKKASDKRDEKRKKKHGLSREHENRMAVAPGR